MDIRAHQPAARTHKHPPPQLSPDHQSDRKEISDNSDCDDSSSDQVSPTNLPTPDSDVADEHPPSPMGDFKAYSQLIGRVAKTMDLSVIQPAQLDQDDKCYDMGHEHTPPL